MQNILSKAESVFTATLATYPPSPNHLIRIIVRNHIKHMQQCSQQSLILLTSECGIALILGLLSDAIAIGLLLLNSQIYDLHTSCN